MSDSETTGDGASATDADAGRRARAFAQIGFNALIAVVAAGLFWQSLGLPSSMWEPLGAGSFPRLALGALIGLNVLLIAAQIPVVIAGPASPRAIARDWIWRRRLAFAVMALFLAYVIGMRWVGFAWASLLFLTVTQLLLGARTPRALAAALVIAVVFSFGLEALFGRVFDIALPAGVGLR